MLYNFSSVLAENINVPGWHWILLISWFALLLILDITFLHKKDHIPTLREAIIQSAGWIGLGIALGILFLPLYGGDASKQYFSGFLIEKSLSIDNVFAWSVILTYFKIPKQYQHRVLFWGVFGALVMRAVFIFAGIAAIDKFEPILLLFGGILLWSGAKILFHDHDADFDPAKSRFIKFVRRMIPVSHHLDGHKLFTIEKGKKVATMLFIALIAIEFTDVLFAIDSVPAILAISRDPFIVFSSNAAAILGLRALYFVFDKIKDRFWILNKTVGLLLVAVGIKMLIAPHHIFGIDWFGIKISTNYSLAFISTIIISSVILSVFIKTPKSLSDN